MKILITGDFALTEPYDVSGIDTKILELFGEGDLNIVNLEAPVTASVSKIEKTGPHIKSDKNSTQEILKALNIDIVTLANNHILDYGEQGVKDTLDFCSNNKILATGAGLNLEEASKTLYVHTADGIIALVNFAENEWTSASNSTAGSNPMDLIENLNQIRLAKGNADFVIIVVHGGNEYNQYPSPRMIKQYRFYADNGADAVISHHTHCISGYETYNNVPIFYGLGNFLFTRDSSKEVWYTGLVLALYVKKGQRIRFEITPVEQTIEDFRLRVPSLREERALFNQIEEVNSAIKNEKILEEKWQEFVGSVEAGFIKSISPLGGVNNRYAKGILYRSGIYKLFLNATYLKEHLNRIRCEAHYDVTQQILKNKLKKL